MVPRGLAPYMSGQCLGSDCSGNYKPLVHACEVKVKPAIRIGICTLLQLHTSMVYFQGCEQKVSDPDLTSGAYGHNPTCGRSNNSASSLTDQPSKNNGWLTPEHFLFPTHTDTDVLVADEMGYKNVLAQAEFHRLLKRSHS